MEQRHTDPEQQQAGDRHRDRRVHGHHDLQRLARVAQPDDQQQGDRERTQAREREGLRAVAADQPVRFGLEVEEARSRALGQPLGERAQSRRVAHAAQGNERMPFAVARREQRLHLEVEPGAAQVLDREQGPAPRRLHVALERRERVGAVRQASQRALERAVQVARFGQRGAAKGLRLRARQKARREVEAFQHALVRPALHSERRLLALLEHRLAARGGRDQKIAYVRRAQIGAQLPVQLALRFGERAQVCEVVVPDPVVSRDDESERCGEQHPGDPRRAPHREPRANQAEGQHARRRRPSPRGQRGQNPARDQARREHADHRQHAELGEALEAR